MNSLQTRAQYDAGNKADRIVRCLESVKDLANEIIVFDSGSTDETVNMARQYTDKLWQTDWPGYGAQKQRALDQAQGDWVLAIDADEALDEELQQSVRRCILPPSMLHFSFATTR